MHAIGFAAKVDAVKTSRLNTTVKPLLATLAIIPLMITGCGSGQSEPQTVTETVKEIPPVTETVTETATETAEETTPSPTQATTQTETSNPRVNPVGTTGDPSNGFRVLEGYVIESCDTSGNYQNGMTYFTNGETGFTTYCANQ
ncbi:hypothetical protein HMPREF1650_10720 [Corynebacterium freneyi DNF00450]|uniref:Uncharacterized protein n=1 Tax=Corynebacterium freneyi DNF00450 TaxID=1287475 RepID=A0A095Y0I0_9CORY|nr:hypothetical protein HMPREF1650_10720 [Corynebacterium freneyi DNF00450]